MDLALYACWEEKFHKKILCSIASKIIKRQTKIKLKIFSGKSERGKGREEKAET